MSERGGDWHCARYSRAAALPSVSVILRHGGIDACSAATIYRSFWLCGSGMTTRPTLARAGVEHSVLALARIAPRNINAARAHPRLEAS